MIAIWKFLRLLALLAAIPGVWLFVLIVSSARVPYHEQGTYSWTTDHGHSITVSQIDAPMAHTILCTLALTIAAVFWLLSLRGRPVKRGPEALPSPP